MATERVRQTWVYCPDCDGTAVLAGSTLPCPRCTKPGRVWPMGMVPAVLVLNDDGLWDGILDALRQYADAENWGYYDGSGCPKGVGDVEEACFIGPDVAREALGLVMDTDASADG